MYAGLPSSLKRLIHELKRFPGIGEKSALRMVLFALRGDRGMFRGIGEAFLDAEASVRICKKCFNIAEDEVCGICSDPARANGMLCVVEDVGDLLAIEKTGRFKGRYHVLSGVVSPLENRSFEDLTIKQLKNTILSDRISEVTIALNPTVEGEATALYLKGYLKDTGVRLFRIACGIPVGSDIEYLDELTMAVALEGRKELE